MPDLIPVEDNPWASLPQATTPEGTQIPRLSIAALTQSGQPADESYNRADTRLKMLNPPPVDLNPGYTPDPTTGAIVPYVQNQPDYAGQLTRFVQSAAQKIAPGVYDYFANAMPPTASMEPNEAGKIPDPNANPYVPGALNDVANAASLLMDPEAIGAAKMLAMAPLAAAARVTPEGLAIAGKDYAKASQGFLRDIAAGPKGAGPLDLSSTAEIPGTAQVPLERYTPARGISPRLQDAIDNAVVQKGLEDSMRAGQAVGADRWYHTEPIRQAWIDELGPEKGTKAFSQFMDMVAATSPRSDVPTNVRNASYYYMHALNNVPLPEKLPYPYGHVAQNLHRQNFGTLTGAANSPLGADVTTGWNILQNPKPASFSQNLQGNLEPVTVDTHAFRNIAMRTQDPRFLETSIVQPLKSETLTPGSLAARYGEIKGDKVIFRPKKLYDAGKLTMEDALKIPAFWASKPNENEYAAAEQLYRNVGNRVGLRPADAQAAAWSGAGELTGLGSPPTHTFPELFNERVLYTAKMRGEDPRDTLKYLITGQKPLLGIAGAGAVGATLIPVDHNPFQ